ncbi:MAG: hypothetical protein HKN04_02835, partial [Rhodothermaceae bacterium]|nr:hypothetical protein [Rhodothermaceae bacterium]
MASSSHPSDPPEPVPFSETTPKADPPDAGAFTEAEGDAAPSADAPEPEPTTSLEAGPDATEQASAAPGPVPVRPSAPMSAAQKASAEESETEQALVASLVQSWRHRRPEPPAPREPTPAEKAGFEVMVPQKPPGLARRFFTVWRHAVGLVYGAAVA